MLTQCVWWCAPILPWDGAVRAVAAPLFLVSVFQLGDMHNGEERVLPRLAPRKKTKNEKMPKR